MGPTEFQILVGEVWRALSASDSHAQGISREAVESFLQEVLPSPDPGNAKRTGRAILKTKWGSCSLKLGNIFRNMRRVPTAALEVVPEAFALQATESPLLKLCLAIRLLAVLCGVLSVRLSKDHEDVAVAMACLGADERPMATETIRLHCNRLEGREKPLSEREVARILSDLADLGSVRRINGRWKLLEDVFVAAV